jgi:hypothetical protein
MLPDLRGCLALALGMMMGGGVFLLGEGLAEQRVRANAAFGVTGALVLRTEPASGFGPSGFDHTFAGER